MTISINVPVFAAKLIFNCSSLARCRFALKTHEINSKMLNNKKNQFEFMNLLVFNM